MPKWGRHGINDNLYRDGVRNCLDVTPGRLMSSAFRTAIFGNKF